MADSDEYGQSPFKKARLNNGNSKGIGSSGSPAANPNSFAARMMAKMGHVQGQGLGASGTGRLAPIETQLRPQGAGLGAVKEKTKQAKEEEKRQAALRGEVLQDSSDEEKKRRRKQKENRMSGVVSGSSTPRGARTKPKQKFRTVTEIEADGLHVPNVLKSIIDLTGKETKVLSSTTGLLTPNESMVPGETESMKIAKRAQRDLDAFGAEWAGLSDRKKHYDFQSSQVITEIDVNTEEIGRLQRVIETIQDLQALAIESHPIRDDSLTWEKITHKLESLEIEFHDEVDALTLQDVTVAAIHPLFRSAMQDWQPLDDPTHLVSYLHRLRHLLGIDHTPDSTTNALTSQSTYLPPNTRSHKSTTPYETLIYSLWLPRVRTTITTTWDVYNPPPLLALLEVWRSLLPPFILSTLLDNLIPQRLSTAITAWSPISRKSSSRHHSNSSQPPHLFLFPWLPLLSPHHTSPTSSTSLLTILLSKLRAILTTYPLPSGPPSFLEPLLPILSHALSQLLLSTILPRLALHLAQHLIIDPSDQDLTPYTTVLVWSPYFATSTFAALLATEFFPLFHNTLHQWLTTTDPGPNYDEISQWFLWWNEQVPDPLKTHPLIDAEWTKALETINLAVDLGPEAAATNLPPPASGPSKPFLSSSSSTTNPLSTTTTPASSHRRPQQPEPQETTFKDVVEDWAQEHGLWMRALGIPHESTGLPLYRVTGNAEGKGGVVGYLKGDVFWVKGKEKEKGKGGSGSWGPVALDEGLVERAGG